MNRTPLSLLLLASLAPLASAQEVPRPKTFGIIFNMGYAGDALPQDKGEFTALVDGLKKAHFNVVLGKYTEQRDAVCKEKGVRMMVDLLVSDHHVYKNVEQSKALCTKLRGNDVVWAYHLWSDQIGGRTAGRNRDIKNVRTWDPTHSTYVGTRNGRDLAGLVDPGAIAYYDFHWKRGGHWRHLVRTWEAAKKTNSYFYRYCQADAGRVGIGNYNRVLYTISTSLAFGMKGYTFHYIGRIVDPKTGNLGPVGKDLARVNAEFAKLGPDLIKIGNPSAVYSTPITKSAKDRPTGQDKPTVPAGLQPIPNDFWAKVNAGEALLGVFADAQKRRYLFVANHNAYQTQKMELTLKNPPKSASIFDRKKGMWTKLAVTNAGVSFDVPPAAGELVRFE